MIPVFLASDEKFAKYMAVTIESIVSGTEEAIEFYVLDGGITKSSKKRITQMLENSLHKIEFLNIDMKYFKNFPVKRHFSINAYFRYLIPVLKPEFKKVLYVDTDMIVNGNIKEIYDIEMQNYGISAVPYLDEFYNKGMYLDYKKDFDIPQEHLYFNSGLLLINCDYWRKNKIVDLLFKKTDELKEKLQAPDQDILNILFINNYKKLDDKYNIVVDLTCDYIDIFQYISQIKGCFVLHYTGGRKMRPWMNKNVPFDHLFWSYAINTPFYSDLNFELIENMIFQQNTLLSTNKLEQKDSVYKILLFGFIPLLKLIKKNKKIYIKLFNCIPLLSIKEKK